MSSSTAPHNDWLHSNLPPHRKGPNARDAKQKLAYIDYNLFVEQKKADKNGERPFWDKFRERFWEHNQSDKMPEEVLPW